MEVLETQYDCRLNTPIDMVWLVKFHFPDRIIALIFMILINRGFLLERIPTPGDELGQSAIEFILTFAFGLGLTFMFASQALNMTKGYLVHYVNFMASRVFLVADAGVEVEATNFQRAESKAQEQFRQYPLSTFGISANMQLNRPSRGQGLFSGAITEFEEELSVLSTVGGKGSVFFYSESFLGREPFRSTCYEMVCEAVSGSTNTCQGSSQQMDVVLYDNGC